MLNNIFTGNSDENKKASYEPSKVLEAYKFLELFMN